MPCTRTRQQSATLTIRYKKSSNNTFELQMLVPDTFAILTVHNFIISKINELAFYTYNLRIMMISPHVNPSIM